MAQEIMTLMTGSISSFGNFMAFPSTVKHGGGRVQLHAVVWLDRGWP